MRLPILFLLTFFGAAIFCSCTSKTKQYTYQSPGSTYNEYKSTQYDKIKYKETKPMKKKK